MALVFQYGSDCLDSQINGEDRLCGDAKFIGVAETVDDFRLAFDVWSNRRASSCSKNWSSYTRSTKNASPEMPATVSLSVS
jgi:hypothetical protein